MPDPAPDIVDAGDGVGETELASPEQVVMEETEGRKEGRKEGEDGDKKEGEEEEKGMARCVL